MKRYNKWFYKGLCNRHTKYTGFTCLQLLTHLYNTYGGIMGDDYNVNNLRIKAIYGVGHSIKQLFDQTNKGVVYAVANET